MHVWVVCMAHENGRFEPKSAHFSEEEARWTAGSLLGDAGVAVTLSRIKIMDSDGVPELNSNVAVLHPLRNHG